MRLIRSFVLALVLPLLAACAGLLESNQPPVSVYVLEPYHDFKASREASPRTLAIRVEASPGLDSNRLQTRAAHGAMSYVSGARWPEYLPEMTASLWREAVEHAGLYRRVVAAPIRSSFDCLLDLRADQFHVLLGVAGMPQQVELNFTGTLRCGERESVIGLRHAEAVSGQGVASVIAAHQAAFDAVSRSLLEQLQSFSPE